MIFFVAAVEKALQFLDKDELPPHWDRELLFSIGESSESGSDAGSDSDVSYYKVLIDCGVMRLESYIV